MAELSRLSRAVFYFSDCAERFQMSPHLDIESRAPGNLARDYGIILYSMARFWERIKPFCLGMESSGLHLNRWHHTDYESQWRCPHWWGNLGKQLTYVGSGQQLG